ncbi:MAG: exodeoxyribonuclease V subunit gamma [Candidatus Dasytiphilus stammeri]
MFRIYHSNHLELLTQLVAYHWKKNPLNDPLISETILVQSNDVAQWFQIALAKELGLSGNIRFYFPEEFIWTIVRNVLPDISEITLVNKDTMIWKILEILPFLLKKKEFKIFEVYLSLETEMTISRKIFQLSCKIAEMYENYLIYRPEWISSWEKGNLIKLDHKDQQWQALLWYTLVANYKDQYQPILHLSNVYQIFISKLKDIKYQILPERIFIVGISTVSPLYLKFLHSLSKYMDIHLMNTNPCRSYWMDINPPMLDWKKRQHQNQVLFGQLKSSLFNSERQSHNPLLASWGKLGSDYLYWLSKIETDEIEAFVDIKGENLLSLIQRDILELEDNSILGITPETFSNSHKKRLLKPQDDSISIHRCINKHHEVEILHQTLVSFMNKNPTLTPTDIIVMVADIDDYYPFIQAVFGQISSPYSLPFSISDVSMVKTYPLLHVFINLLKLSEIHTFTSEYIFSVLDVPEIILHFNINENDLWKIRSQADKYSFIWKNINNENFNSSDPVSVSWIPEEEITNFDNDEIKLANKIYRIVKKLCHWRKLLSEKRIISQWMTICRDLVNDFFIQDKNTERVCVFLENQWRQMLLEGIFYPDNIHCILLCDKFITRLDNIKMNEKFLTEGINFSSLIPMRSLPFKIVCLLGMNEGVYPRSSPTVGFNLMSSFPQRGDRNIREEDKYLFLESLLCARNIFYVSYVDHVFQDNKIQLPSVLVRELINYISQSFSLPSPYPINLDRSAQLVREHLVCIHTKLGYTNSFSEQLYLRDPMTTRISGIDPENCKNKSCSKNSALQKLNIQQFLFFWHHPVRAFLQNTLGVNFLTKEEWIPNSNYRSLAVERSKRYEINKKLLSALIKGENTKVLQKQYLAEQSITENTVFEEIYWHKQQNRLNYLAEQIRQYYCTAIYRKPINFLLSGGIRLLGYLSQVQDDGLLRWRPRPLNFQDGLRLWLEHLIYCCVINKAGTSRMFGQNNTQWCFSSLTRNEATEWLIYFIKGYQLGLRKPLLLLPQSSSAWIKASFNVQTANICYDKRTKFKARQKIFRTWFNSPQRGGESNDPYLQRLLGASLNELQIQEIITNAEKWLLPLMIFNNHSN